MKKIFISLFAVAAFAACAKTEVAYESADEIGFQVVTGKMTKAAVEGTTYPTTLDMYVFAMTETDAVANTEADFLDKALFSHAGSNLWAGSPDPYYWPNIKNLFFAGVSKSGNVTNVADATEGVPSYSHGHIIINDYLPGVGTKAEGDNDLMWFPTTSKSYGKLQDNIDKVQVAMYHACSWITIKIGGDDYTAGKYTITDVTIKGLTTKGSVDLGDTADWTLFAPVDADNVTAEEAKYLNQDFKVFNGNAVLPLNGTKAADPVVFENEGNSVIVLPEQIPGDISIAYKFTSQAGEIIEEIVTGSLKFNGNSTWAAGFHYTYNIKITASQILIAPTVDGWDPSPVEGAHGVTVY